MQKTVGQVNRCESLCFLFVRIIRRYFVNVNPGCALADDYLGGMFKTMITPPVAAMGFAALMIASGCGSTEQETTTELADSGQTFYGSVIDIDGATDAVGLRSVLSETGRAQVKFEGEVTATCAKKGCWMDVASGEDTVFVRFQDYGFFVPTEGAEGKRTVMEGEAFFDTITVEMRKHYAEDAGESEEVIAAITEPELRLAFTATGVMIED